MAGERVDTVRIKIVGDASELVGESTKVGDALASAGKKGAEGLGAATGAADGLGAGLKDAIEPSKALEAAITKASNALSPRGMIDGAARIRQALEDIQAEAQRTGKAIGPDLAAQMERGQATITGAVGRAGRLNETMQSLRKEAGLTADRLEFLAAATASPDRAFSDMAKTGSGLTKVFGEMGLKAIVAGNVLTLVDTGARLLSSGVRAANEAIQQHLNAEDAWALKMANVRAQQEKTSAAVALAVKGLIPLGGSLKDVTRAADEYAIAQGRWGAKQKELAESAGVVIPNLKQISSNAKILGETMESAFRRGSAEGLAFAKANETSLKAAEEHFRSLGEAAPKGIRMAIDAMKEAEEEARRFAQEIKALSEAHKFDIDASRDHLKALKDLVQGTESAITAAQKQFTQLMDQRDAKIKALREEASEEADYMQRKRAIEAEYDAQIQESIRTQEEARKRQQEGIRKEIESRKDAAEAIAYESQQVAAKNAMTDEEVKKNELIQKILADLKSAKGEVSKETQEYAKQLREEMEAQDAASHSMVGFTESVNSGTSTVTKHVDVVVTAEGAHQKLVKRVEDTSQAVDKNRGFWEVATGAMSKFGTAVHDTTKSLDALVGE